MIQSIVSTVALLFMMFQTTLLDQASRWEMDLTEERCRGCCAMHNESLISIMNEPYLSGKLHKFSRAVRKYDIPEEILNILHVAEHKIQEFENELQQFKKAKFDRISQLQDTLIEEDVNGEDLKPKGKPKWKKPERKLKEVEKKTAAKNKIISKSTALPVNKIPSKIANDVQKQLSVNIPV